MAGFAPEVVSLSETGAAAAPATSPVGPRQADPRPGAAAGSSPDVSPRALGYMPELTGLRGIAAFWVVALHAMSYHYHATGYAEHPISLYFARFGWVGVDIFFVLSGFLLALPLLARGGRRLDAGRWRRYLISRFTRIVPPYYGALLLAVVLIALQPQLVFDAVDLLRHAAFVHNFWPDNVLSLNPVAWTLAVEVQFYLLLPLVASLFIGRRWIPSLFVALVITLLYRTWSFEYADAAHVTWLNLQLPAFTFHFALGITAARLYLSDWRLPLRARWVIPLAVGLFGVLPCTVLLTDWIPADLNHRLSRLLLRPMVAVAATILLYSVVTQTSVVARLLRTHPLQHAGDISYSVYLLHMPVLAFFTLSGPLVHEVGFPVYFVGALFVSWATGVAFYQLVERPSLALKGLLLSRGRVPSPAPPLVAEQAAPTPLDAE